MSSPERRPRPEDFRVDSAGRTRRLCDELTTTKDYLTGFPERCSNYASAEVIDPRWGKRMVCTLHDPARRSKETLCEHPTAWDAGGVPNKWCPRRARWLTTAYPPAGAWYCSQHDPARPRCQAWRNHPISEATILALAGRGLEVRERSQDPYTPRATGGKLFGVRLCEACRHRRPAPPDSRPCNLCAGAMRLEVDAGPSIPCVCTPEGRELANGAPDAVVLARLAAE